jgi:hypothetical protein
LVDFPFDDIEEEDGLAGVVREEQLLLLLQEETHFTVVLGGIEIHHVQKFPREVLFIKTAKRAVDVVVNEGRDERLMGREFFPWPIQIISGHVYTPLLAEL